MACRIPTVGILFQMDRRDLVAAGTEAPFQRIAIGMQMKLHIVGPFVQGRDHRQRGMSQASIDDATFARDAYEFAHR